MPKEPLKKYKKNANSEVRFYRIFMALALVLFSFGSLKTLYRSDLGLGILYPSLAFALAILLTPGIKEFAFSVGDKGMKVEYSREEEEGNRVAAENIGYSVVESVSENTNEALRILTADLDDRQIESQVEKSNLFRVYNRKLLNEALKRAAKTGYIAGRRGAAEVPVVEVSDEVPGTYSEGIKQAYSDAITHMDKKALEARGEEVLAGLRSLPSDDGINASMSLPWNRHRHLLMTEYAEIQAALKILGDTIE